MFYLSVTGRVNINGKMFHIAGIFGPLISAIIIKWQFEGRAGVVNLLKKAGRIKCNTGLYIFTILIFPLISIVSLIIQYSFDIKEIDLGAFRDIWSLAVLFIIMLLFAPVGEEFGWRGFLLEEYQEEFSILKSSVLVGLAWGSD